MTPEQERQLKEQFIKTILSAAAKARGETGGKSYFDEEAERIANLNKAKERRKFTWKKLAIFSGLGVGVLIASVLLWLYSIFAYGFVMTKLWAWFVVPVFTGLAEVKFGILQAAGLFMFVRFFTHQHKYVKHDPDEETSDKIAKAILPIIVPWLTLFFGWALTKLM